MKIFNNIKITFMLFVAAPAIMFSSCSKGSKNPAPAKQTVTVSTFAGSGTVGLANGIGSAATFKSPSSVKIGSDGSLYVGDWLNNVIRKIDVSNGTVSTFAGTGTQGFTNGAAGSATFYHPCGVVFDSKGNLFVSELGNFSIRKIATDGTVSTFAGTGSSGDVDGDASKATFNQPIGIVFDKDGNMYVADEFNNKIRKITITSSLNN